MAGKKYTVINPIRFKGKLIGVGGSVTATQKELEGIEHCVTEEVAVAVPQGGQGGGQGGGSGDGADGDQGNGQGGADGKDPKAPAPKAPDGK